MQHFLTYTELGWEKGARPKSPLPSTSNPFFYCFSDLPIFRQYHPQSAIQAKQFPRLLPSTPPSPTFNSFTMSSWFNFPCLSPIHLYLSNPTAAAWHYALCISHLANHTALMPLPSFSPFSTLFQNFFIQWIFNHTLLLKIVWWLPIYLSDNIQLLSVWHEFLPVLLPYSPFQTTRTYHYSLSSWNSINIVCSLTPLCVFYSSV